MNKEKVFWLLNIESIEGLKDSTNYPWKFFCIFDICISVGIVLFGLITGYIGTSAFHLISVMAILATTALFAFCLRLASKVTLIVPCTSLIPCVSALKSCYGYWVFSVNEFNEKGYSFFSWLHATILIFALSLFFLLIFSQIKIYKDARKMSFDELTDRTERTKANAAKLVKSHPWIRIFPLILPSPYIACKLLKRGEIGEGLGMGFGMWVLACCYIIFISMYLPRFFIYAKYRKLILGTENNHSENN